MQTEELKKLAMAVKGTCDSPLRDKEWVAFRYAASPTVVLELIARIEELEAKVDDYGRALRLSGAVNSKLMQELSTSTETAPLTAGGGNG